MKRTITTAAAGLLLLLAGCGADSAAVQNTPAATGLDTPTSAPAQSPEPATTPDPMLVEPRPGMTNLRPVNWESATPRGDRLVRVRFYGGVPPCDVLDSVEVDYGKQAVTITLFSGSDPARPDAVCIEIAKLKAVDVELSEDLAGRELVDGAGS